MKVIISPFKTRKCPKCGKPVRENDHATVVWSHGERLKHYPDCENPAHGRLANSPQSIYEITQ